ATALTSGSPAPAVAAPSATAAAPESAEAVLQSRELVHYKVLVFVADRSAATNAGIDAIRKVGLSNRFTAEVTSDPGDFNQRHLKKFGVVVFLNTSAAVLNAAQQAAFEAYF